MRRGWAVLGAAMVLGCGSEEPREETLPPVGPTDLVVPAETADALALARLGSWDALPVFTSDRYLQASSYDRETRPPTQSALLANGNRDMNNFVCRSADAEMGGSVVEPAFDLETCPEDYVRGLVLARVDGPARLARFQLTQLSLRNQPADDEMLRFWVDDDPRPFIQVPLAAALDGSAGEIFAPPFGRGYPHSLAWYYPVSFTKRLVVAIDHVGPLDLVYYQLDFVANAEHQSPPGARSPERDAAKALLSGDAPPELSEMLAPASFSVSPGQTATVATLSGPATVHELAVTIARVDLPRLGELTLSITWDSEPAPAIAAPLAVLFASALSEPTEPSLALGSSATADEVTLWLRLPMPFRTSAAVTLESSASAAVELSMALRGKPGVPAESFGKLHAEIRTTLAPASGSHHPVSSHAGPGRHVGTCLMLEGHGLKDDPLSSPLNFLEGDFRGVVDGAHALRDTGTEDFLDGCFYFESGPFGSALAHAWGVVDDGTSGRVSACRWHALAAAIDYESSFELDLEIGPGEPSLLDRYRSVALSYR